MSTLTLQLNPLKTLSWAWPASGRTAYVSCKNNIQYIQWNWGTNLSGKWKAAWTESEPIFMHEVHRRNTFSMPWFAYVPSL
jgi:hypothetical protein